MTDRAPKFDVGDRVRHQLLDRGTISSVGKYYSVIDSYRPAVRFDAIPIEAGDLEVDENELQHLSGLEWLAEQAE